MGASPLRLIAEIQYALRVFGDGYWIMMHDGRRIKRDGLGRWRVGHCSPVTSSQLIYHLVSWSRS